MGLDDIDTLKQKTTSNFSGFVAKIGEGWVSRWLQIEEPLLAGVYAIDVKSDFKIIDQQLDEYEDSDEDEGDEREVAWLILQIKV